MPAIIRKEHVKRNSVTECYIRNAPTKRSGMDSPAMMLRLKISLSPKLFFFATLRISIQRKRHTPLPFYQAHALPLQPRLLAACALVFVVVVIPSPFLAMIGGAEALLELLAPHQLLHGKRRATDVVSLVGGFP
ncbi:hypothetical protein CABS01_17148 [Colletotrichum abscissum]|uniref:uncharacterized protein n=1 Tax=Colletotrichum abscissum TaxID=1671311 RepID=UPI0027D5CCDE|nr:uncharacterized protein CABS01_17148 [Colletotrichum abscissum]KAK1489746.1 hypothetical protein CABS01_17148 [Colletotrichum abscissum]